MSVPLLFKVNTKKKKEPCRICNTKTRPCIDLIKNSDLLNTVSFALGIVVLPETRLSKAICVVCMSLVRMFDEFKQICIDTQNDLWKMESQFVKDRGSLVVDLLVRAKNTSIPGQPLATSDAQNTSSQDEVKVQTKKPRFEDTTPPTIAWSESESDFSQNQLDDDMIIEEEMIEEHLDDFVDDAPALRFMCSHASCDRLFETKEEMEEHCKSHIIFCARKNPYVSNKPRNIKLTNDAYTCQVCKKSFEDIAGLVQHRKVNHIQKQCGFCSMIVPSESFIAHQAQCKREKAKKLDILEPRRSGGLKSEIVEIAPDQPLFKCGLCNAQFRTIETYKVHHKICSKPD
uniref:CSON007860 protein n=1 Tax=Culicoides sonorensis TaxID=179676 RepID=A0A336LY07_CULSO